MGVDRGAGSFLSCFCGFESCLYQEFELFWEFGLFWEFCEILDFQILQSLFRDWLRIGYWAVRKLYSLFCIFISVIISISFVVLLNCLYLNLQVFPFVHFSSPSCWGRKGRGERVAVWC